MGVSEEIKLLPTFFSLTRRQLCLTVLIFASALILKWASKKKKPKKKPMNRRNANSVLNWTVVLTQTDLCSRCFLLWFRIISRHWRAFPILNPSRSHKVRKYPHTPKPSTPALWLCYQSLLDMQSWKPWWILGSAEQTDFYKYKNFLGPLLHWWR